MTTTMVKCSVCGNDFDPSVLSRLGTCPSCTTAWVTGGKKSRKSKGSTPKAPKAKRAKKVKHRPYAGKGPGYRLCGLRVVGGVYATTSFGRGGGGGGGGNERSFSDFVLCPPIPVTDDQVKALGLTAFGVKQIPNKEGGYDIWDIIGADHYPSPADYWEEVDATGSISRRCEGIDYSLVTEKTHYVLLHPKAIIANPQAYYDAMPWKPGDWHCKAGNHGHEGGKEPGQCVSLYWVSQDPDAGEVATGERLFGMSAMDVPLAGSTYRAGARPDHIDTEDDGLGIFARVPLARIEVVNDPDNTKKFQAKKSQVRRSGLKVVFVGY